MNTASPALEQPDPAVRKRVLELLADATMPGVDDVLVQGLLDPDRQVGGRAVEILAFRYPWLALDAAKTGPLSASKCQRYRFGPAWHRLRRALAQVAHNLPAGGALSVARFGRLPALLPDLMQELSLAGRPAEATRVGRFLCAERQHGGVSRQILFAVTYACNLRCPYCYVKEWERRFSSQMSRAAFRAALAWCRRQDVNWIIFGGGEPTVHREFGALIREAGRHAMRISLTSNGLYGKAVRDCVRPPVIPEFICHVDQTLLQQDPRRAERLRENIAAARDAGVAVRLRYTLTAQSDHHERQAILDVARSAGLGTVNYGFAFQNIDGTNDFFAHTGRSKRTFDDVLNRFMDEAREAGIGLHLSKPFPLCHVTPRTLRRTATEGGLRMACTAWRRGYSMNLTVNPDLTTLPCNAIGTPGPRLTEFEDFHAAGTYHAALLRPLFDHPWQPKCARCVLFHRGICQGVCLAEHYSALKAIQGQTDPRHA